MTQSATLKAAMDTARRQIPASAYVPFAIHTAANVVKLRENGDLCATWRLHGMSFDTASVEQIAAAKNQLVNFLHSVRGTDQAEPTALWFHRVRRRVNDRLIGVFPNDFARNFDRRYGDALGGKLMLRNELYVTLIVRPLEGVARAVRRGRTRSAEALRTFDREAHERFEALTHQVDASFAKFGGERLTCTAAATPTGNRVVHSEMLSFFKYLLTGVWEKVPVQAGSIANYLCDARLFAGDRNGLVQIHHPLRDAFVGYLDLMDYPAVSEPGMNNCLFYGRYEFIETQSFSFMNKRQGVETLKLQQKRLISSGEGSPEQIEHLDDAVEDIRNGRVFLGEYHYTLGVFGDTVAETRRHMSSARTALQEEAGYKVASVDQIPECAHFAQLPGNWRWRPREAKVTTRNLACMAPLHNFDLGKRSGNPWGEPIAMFQTPALQPYFFNFHDSPIGRNSLAEKLPGNMFLCGQTGAGKSALMSFLVSQATRIPKLRVLLFDKDRGSEVFIRAMGGRYRQLRRGAPTGFNPFQWAPTDRTIKFVEKLVLQCARRSVDEALDVRQENTLVDAVRRVFQLPNQADRRISALLQFFGEHSDLGVRMGKWCRTGAKAGANAWVLDNARDTTDFGGHSIFGFDYTDFLDDTECGPVILSYILEAADTLLNGDPFIYVMEEFAKMVRARSQTLVEFATDKQTTIRKLNGLGIFVTQSPSQVKDHPIGATLREQCVTQLFMANPAADYDDYVEGFRLSPTEFETIKSFTLDSHQFLVKQGDRTAICQLDLSGLRDELEVISGTLDNVMLLDALRAELRSDDPGVWMAPFLERVRQRRSAAVAPTATSSIRST